ncbi:hypothetical protein HCN44_002125 [Aphidius gifuensis]|uniref:Uncharacterized protein n=2 Tax=Aphidius gifuensis TaxID=684658 RepID=A0A834XZK9_APHGI|nr:hypothetical protein HCN44_002125 [Aphidius gifuensis]
MKNIILSSASIVQDTLDMLEIIGNKTISSIVLNNMTSFHSIWSTINKFQLTQYETNYNFEINQQEKPSIVSNYEKKLNDYFSRIQFLRDRTEDWSTLIRRNNTLILGDSTTDIISNDDDYPRSVLTKLHNLFFGRISELITGHDHNHLLQSINKFKCNMKTSKQHQLYSLYNTILFTEVQAFSVLAFSYMWRSINILTKFDYTNEMAIDMSDSRNRIIDFTRLFKKEMKIASNFIRRCDPLEDHKKGKTYDAFDNLMYSFVTNQRYLEPWNNVNCKSNCKAVTPYKRFCELHGEDCSVNHHWYDNTCPGKIYDCEYASSTFEICRRDPIDESSTKLYNWFKNKNNGTIYGDATRKCGSTEEIEEENVSWLPWSNTCDVCLCKCLDNRIDTNSNSIRAFSLLQSRTSDNMVATGARLVTKDRMVHIQLREAKLLSNGKIDKTTEKWIPLPTFNYENNFPNEAVYSDGQIHPLKRDRDFVLLGRDIEDNICFQKLVIDTKYLLIGANFGIDYFEKNQNQRKLCIKLEAEYVLYNFHGETFPTDTKYHLNTFFMPLTKLVLDKPDNPLKFKENMKDSEDNQFVTISVSDFVKDASQSTIPFIDLLEVTTNPSVPLNGIELFHKGQINGTSGGFISLKIHPIDFTTDMNI